MTRVVRFPGRQLEARLAADPAPLTALTAVTGAVEGLLAAAAWPNICQGRDTVAERVRERLRHRVMEHRVGPTDRELLVGALFEGQSEWRRGGGRDDAWTLSWDSGYAAWLRWELRDDPEAFQRYLGYAAVTGLQRESPPWLQVTFGGVVSSAGGAGIPLTDAPWPVTGAVIALGLVEAVIGLRREFSQARLEDQRSRTEIAREKLREKIYEQALGQPIADEVVELAVRTSVPSAYELTTGNVAELELRNSPSAPGPPPA